MKKHACCLLLSAFVYCNSNAQDSSAYRMGYESYSKLRFDDAIYWFSKAIKNSTYRLPDCYRFRGMAAAFKNDFSNAGRDLFISYNMDSLNNRITYQIGKYYYLQDKFDSAVFWYTKAVNGKNQDPDFFDSRALAYAGLNQLKNALKDANIAVKQNPQSDIYLNNRGLIKQKQADYKAALADFTKALQIDSSLSGSLSTYINIAFCYLKTGHYNKSLALCNSILNRFPLTPYALAVRGQTYIALQKTNEACGDFNLLSTIDEKMANQYKSDHCK